MSETTCDWTEEETRCDDPAVYETHWGKPLCREHGAIVMHNHGIGALRIIEPAFVARPMHEVWPNKEDR